MTDSTLNRFLASGTAAERAAFTPDPPTPASGPDPCHLWFETDTGILYAYATGVWTAISGGGSSGISFVGSANFSQDGNTALTFNYSSLVDDVGGTPTIQADDFCLINYGWWSGVDESPSPPTGFTLRANLNVPAGLDANQYVWYRVLTGSETTISIPQSDHVDEPISGQVFVFRGVDPATPFDVADTTSTVLGNAAAITPTTAGAWIVVACEVAASGADTTVWTQPSDLSSTTNHFRSVSKLDNGGVATTGMGIKTDWTSGAFDPGLWPGGPAAAWASSCNTMALRPA